MQKYIFKNKTKLRVHKADSSEIALFRPEGLFVTLPQTQVIMLNLARQQYLSSRAFSLRFPHHF